MSIIVTFPWSFLHLQTSPSSKQFEDAKNELRNVTSVCVFIASLLETVVHNQLICRFIFADFYPRIEDIWSGFQTCQNYLQLKHVFRQLTIVDGILERILNPAIIKKLSIALIKPHEFNISLCILKIVISVPSFCICPYPAVICLLHTICDIC